MQFIISITVLTVLYLCDAIHFLVFFKKTPVLYIFLAFITLHDLKWTIFRFMTCKQIRSDFHPTIVCAVDETVFALWLDVDDKFFVCYVLTAAIVRTLEVGSFKHPYNSFAWDSAALKACTASLTCFLICSFSTWLTDRLPTMAAVIWVDSK